MVICIPQMVITSKTSKLPTVSIDTCGHYCHPENCQHSSSPGVGVINYSLPRVQRSEDRLSRWFAFGAI